MRVCSFLHFAAVLRCIADGCCSCVVAGRLANLDHNLQVMLIEAGESNLNNPWVYRPGIYPRNMKLDSKTASFYYSRPSEWLGGRRAVVPCAHILGGGSSINFMVSECSMQRC